MAKPVEDEEQNNLERKKGTELNPTVAMIINAIIMIIIMGISMVVMYYVLDSSMSKKLAKYLPQEEQSNSDEEEDAVQEGVLFDLGEFVLNLADPNTKRYLKVAVAMELSKTDEEIANAQNPTKPSGHGESTAVDPVAQIVASMERYKPAIRDAVISVLSNKTSDELSSPTGKELAKEEILESVNNIFDGQREVLRVSFGQFIIQ